MLVGWLIGRQAKRLAATLLEVSLKNAEALLNEFFSL
jgi:hypothetical protein